MPESDHGTYVRYKQGCRCRLCQGANATYKKARRQLDALADRLEEVRSEMSHPVDCSCFTCHYGHPSSFRYPGQFPPVEAPSELGCPPELRGLGWREENGWWEPAWRAVVEGRDRFGGSTPEHMRRRLETAFSKRSSCLHCGKTLPQGHQYYCNPRCMEAAALKAQVRV